MSKQVCDKCGAPLISIDEVEAVAYLLMKKHNKSIMGTVPLSLEAFIPEAKSVVYEMRLKNEKAE